MCSIRSLTGARASPLSIVTLKAALPSFRSIAMAKDSSPDPGWYWNERSSKPSDVQSALCIPIPSSRVRRAGGPMRQAKLTPRVR